MMFDTMEPDTFERKKPRNISRGAAVVAGLGLLANTVVGIQGARAYRPDRIAHTTTTHGYEKVVVDKSLPLGAVVTGLFTECSLGDTAAYTVNAVNHAGESVEVTACIDPANGLNILPASPLTSE